MARDDVEAIAPADAAVALRSYPRRYREAVVDDDGALLDDELWAPGPDGTAPVELVVDTVRSLSLLDRALEQVLVQDRPTLLAAVADPAQRHFDVAAHHDVEELLIELGLVATALAERVERTHGESWNRVAAIAGGGELTALDVAREAVRTGGDNLRELKQRLAAAG